MIEAPNSIAPATPDDVPIIVSFICALAEYEHLTHQCRANEADLHRALFGERPWAEALIARCGGEPAGYALFFHTYSTFLGTPGLFLEDLFVLPAFRRRGIGTAMMRRVAAIARERGCGRLEWTVLEWNAPAIDLYRGLGAEVLPDWRMCRMSAGGIAKLADGEGST
jgi:GNAT superfamily N-acetyltransferase